MFQQELQLSILKLIMNLIEVYFLLRLLIVKDRIHPSFLEFQSLKGNKEAMVMISKITSVLCPELSKEKNLNLKFLTIDFLQMVVNLQ